MKKASGADRVIRRLCVGAVVALLVFVQLFAGFGTLKAHAQSSPAGDIVMAYGEHCAPRTDQSNGKPSPQHHNHADCCLFCATRDVVAALVLSALGVAFALLFVLRTHSIKWRRIDGGIGRADGWASSWSSRAPPSSS